MIKRMTPEYKILVPRKKVAMKNTYNTPKLMRKSFSQPNKKLMNQKRFQQERKAMSVATRFSVNSSMNSIFF